MDKCAKLFGGIGRSLLGWGVFMALLVSCSALEGDVFEAQADIYNEYKDRLDTVSSYQNAKAVNEELERELVDFIKANGEKFADAGKNANDNSAGEKRLAKAEADYIQTYLNRFFQFSIKEQIALYAEYSSKIACAASYEELLALDSSLGSALADINSKSSAEIKVANAKSMMKEQFAELSKAQKEYIGIYAGNMAPYVYGKEKGIYEKYLSKLADAKGYEQIKEVRLYQKSEIAIFGNSNAKVYQHIAENGYAAEKSALSAAKENFERSYMVKMAPEILAYRKQIYEGALEILASAKNVEELDRANNAFMEVSNRFMNDNAEELQWIEKSAMYKREIGEVNACFEKIIRTYERKASELAIG